MSELKYVGPKTFGHIVYGPVTRKPYRVYPNTVTEIEDDDVETLLATGGWKKTRKRTGSEKTEPTESLIEEV